MRWIVPVTATVTQQSLGMNGLSVQDADNGKQRSNALDVGIAYAISVQRIAGIAELICVLPVDPETNVQHLEDRILGNGWPERYWRRK